MGLFGTLFVRRAVALCATLAFVAFGIGQATMPVGSHAGSPSIVDVIDADALKVLGQLALCAAHEGDRDPDHLGEGCPVCALPSVALAPPPGELWLHAPRASALAVVAGSTAPQGAAAPRPSARGPPGVV